MTNPSFSSTLYDCATACALRRQRRKCKERFGSYACNDCKLYVNRYVDADPRKVDLFMLEAERRAYDFRAALRYPFIIIAILIVIVLLILFLADLRKSGFKIPEKTRTAVEAPQVTTPRFALATGNYVKDIEDTLRKVATAMRANTDVNGDGLVNCIDAAVLFYQFYPRRNEVTIIHNLNNGTNMNHLFNGVMIGNTWRGIEPQAYFSNRASFYMTDIWGSSYEHTKNTIVTAYYSKFAR